jgi:hypothetical protein
LLYTIFFLSFLQQQQQQVDPTSSSSPANNRSASPATTTSITGHHQPYLLPSASLSPLQFLYLSLFIVLRSNPPLILTTTIDSDPPPPTTAPLSETDLAGNNFDRRRSVRQRWKGRAHGGDPDQQEKIGSDGVFTFHHHYSDCSKKKRIKKIDEDEQWCVK